MGKKYTDEQIEAIFEFHFGPPKTPIPLIADTEIDPETGERKLGFRLDPAERPKEN